MPIFNVDIKLDNLEITAGTRVEAMFWAKETLPKSLWSHISNMTSSETAESKKARAEAEEGAA